MNGHPDATAGSRQSREAHRLAGWAIGFCLTMVGFTSSALAAGLPTERGAALFTEKCAMCHRVMGMGTVLLSRRRDAATAQLEKRTDLTPEFVTAAARAGLGNMPRISRGEVSDKDLATIAAWLAVPVTSAAGATDRQ